MPQSELTARQIAELPFGLYLRNPASGWRELPALWAELTVRADLAAVPLRFHIWPAARRKEVRLARWPEDDLTAGVWIIPTERTKGRRLHRVPLSDAARDVLRAASAIRRDELIFPGANHGQPIGEISLRGLLHQLRRGVTAHGFRSGYRDWAAHNNKVPEEQAGATLAHVAGGTLGTCQREDLLQARRPVMQRWACLLMAPARAEAKMVMIWEAAAG